MHKDSKTISATDEAVHPELKQIRVLIAAGGTGGHVYPAIAIADALKNMQPDIAIKFVGTKTHMEWEAVPQAGYDIASIWISGFHRRFTLKNILFPIKLAVSLWQSLRIITAFKPDVMISCGGYVAGPVGWIADKKGVLLFIQEQNSFPGITNRMLAPKAEKIFTAFKDADHHFPPRSTVQTGNPVRKTLTNVNRCKAYEYFSFTSKRYTLLVLGGSGGARRINEAMAKNIEKLHHTLGLQIIWQCGKHYYEALHNQIDIDRYPRLCMVDFLHHMAEAYAVADVVVSRAGALSCAEITLTGNASILVPSPNVAGDHQMKNVQSMVKGGAACLLKDKDVKKRLPELVKKLISDQQKRKMMQEAALKMARPDAVQDIAEEILGSVINPNDKES
jgi:UDP-N-acetylglucosamine--N-acetylmuramyl-(pentapeptide) pyrophosphoryl-undecaprenol N-acetylglucosamine transferase